MKLPRTALLMVSAAAVALLGVLTFAALQSAVSKSRLEQMASAALDMDVHIGGATHIRLFPELGVNADDVHLQRDGAELVSVRRARIALSLFSLLRGPRRISAVELEGATLSMQQGADGHFNFQQRGNASTAHPEVRLARFDLKDGTLIFTTARGETFARFDGCDLQLGDVQLAAGERSNLLQRLSAHGRGSCRQIWTHDLQVAEPKFSVTGDTGRFVFAPIALRAYGGQGSADLRADLSGDAPIYKLQYQLKEFRIEEWLRVYSPKKIASGEVNFTATLALRGRTLTELKRSSNGTLSLRGQKLTLQIGDLDQELSRYESTQQFNLVDLGAILLGGPAGLLVTKGYDFARALHGPGGVSEVPLLVSDWRVENGQAQATDVAMTTATNRVALKGDLDLVDGHFGDVTVAVVDNEGCARVLQKVHGRFGAPEIDKPNVLMAVSGPARRLLTEAKKKLLGSRCEPFYSGSLASPPPAAEEARTGGPSRP